MTEWMRDDEPKKKSRYRERDDREMRRVKVSDRRRVEERWEWQMDEPREGRIKKEISKL